jgi:uncharacterized membrane protein
MAFCKNCGTQVQDEVRFCPTCGEEIESAPAPTVATSATQPPQAAAQPQQQSQQPYQQQPPANDADANKGMAILAYILFFIPLLTGAHKTSPFVKFHANQGTVLALFAVAWGIIYGILTAILTAILLNPATWYSGGWGTFGIVTTILGILWLAPVILCIIGIINAASGKTKPLPVLGKITIIK